MNKTLTQRALRVFAVLEDYRAGSPDILDALLPFFEPIIAEFNGHVLNQELFATRVREAYRWNFTADIVEELIPRFQSKGWVHEVTGVADTPAYRVSYSSAIAESVVRNETKIEQALLSATQEFKSFIDTISPLSGFNRTANELSDILVEWLISIDAYSEDVLRKQAIQTTYVGGQLGLAVTLDDTSALSTEERYLCARFVRHLFEQKSPIVTDLCKLASVGLLTEVIQDFQKPITQVNRTTLNIYLDAPVALDFLGVSGKASAANTRAIISKLQEIGATVRIFRISVDELQHALDAVLKRSAPHRTGPTADAIRRNEVAEAYVREVAQDPDRALTTLGVGIVARTLDQFPNEHEFFDQDKYEKLFSKMTWHYEMPRRTHDTTIVSLVVRMRTGTQSRDLFQSKHLLITRNGALAQLGRKFCVDEDIIAARSVSPVIHQRQLATAVWLRTGLSDGASDVPRTHLLAACERVLELKKGVVDQVRIAARNLTPEKAEQLEMLLTQDRSAQLLMDKTLGASAVISSTNIESLVDSMRLSLVSEIQRDADEKVAAANREAASKIRKAQEARRAAEKEALKLEINLGVIDTEDRILIQQLIGDVNSRVRTSRRLIKIGVGIVVTLVGAIPLLTDSMSGFLKLLALAVGGAIGASLAFLQLLDKPTGIERSVQRFAEWIFKRTADKRRVSSKVSRFDIRYVDGQFKLFTSEVTALV
jgi:hypothetical protein